MSAIEKILQPIPGDSAVGTALEDDAQLHFIDDEMMKVGSLSHGSIAWDKVERSALEILCGKSKDIKVLANYLQCMQQDADAAAMLSSLQLLSAFIGAFWLQAFPKPGPKGAGLRAKLLKQILQRSAIAAKKVERFDATGDDVQKVLQQLRETLEAAKLDIAALDPLRAALVQQESEVASQPPPDEDAEGAQEGTIEAPKVPKVYFDPKNERATRQALMSMADFLNITDPQAALGYRVRRHALWFSITQLPACKRETTTELAAFSAERYSDYCQALAREGDLALLKKLERSLEQAPYWFDGHHLSYQLCRKLGFGEAAQAVLLETQAFIERFPQLLDYCYSDGSHFANEQTRQWLRTATTAEQGSGTAASDWDAERQRVLELCQREGLDAALRLVDDQLRAAGNPRDNHYWRLINADLLSSQGLVQLAQMQLRALMESAQGMSLQAWEPSFVQHITQSLDITDN